MALRAAAAGRFPRRFAVKNLTDVWNNRENASLQSVVERPQLWYAIQEMEIIVISILWHNHEN